MVVRTAVSSLKSTYKLQGHQLADEVERALNRIKRRKRYIRPALTRDRLYKPDAVHPIISDSYNNIYDTAELVACDNRDEEDDNPTIYYGLITSGNQLMKDVRIRDKLARDKGVLCFEMEAASLINHFPCLIIRSIYDYSDSYKNKE
jgi:nucleoside phosphorylase